MFAPRQPEPWEIDELERLRRVDEDGARPHLELPLVPPPAPSERAPAPSPSRVVVIQVW